MNDPFAERRWKPVPGTGLTFDARYRLAQLPLVAPDHERVIRRAQGLDYENARYERARVSLIADLGIRFLQHETVNHLILRLERVSFTRKIAWEMHHRRAAMLHVTLIGDADPTPEVFRSVRSLLSRASALSPIVHGPFVGTFNRGRIYLPLEFDRQEDKALLTRLSGTVGRAPQEFIAAGVANLRDELTPDEAIELAALIDDLRGAGRRHSIDQLSWTSTHDDLTLDSRYIETLRSRN